MPKGGTTALGLSLLTTKKERQAFISAMPHTQALLKSENLKLEQNTMQRGARGLR